MFLEAHTARLMVSPVEFVAAFAEKIAACTDVRPNYLLRGTFTLRGINRPLKFPVLIATKDDDQQLTCQSVLELDRTTYGSHYGSGKLFRFLSQHLVNDYILLHVKMHTDRPNKLREESVVVIPSLT
jgi:hypothetical protein